MTYIGKKDCWFFDVGGDHFISFRNLEKLRNRCFGKPNSIFISHFDKDHIRFYSQLNQMLPLNAAYVTHLDTHTKTAKRMLEYFEKHGISIIRLKTGDEIRTLDSSLKILWPSVFFKSKKNDENSMSLVLLFKTLKKSILLTGDFPGKLEKFLPAISADILKVAHHGSHKSSFQNFLKNTRAKTCVISVGKNNKFDHPRKELLKRLQKINCAILRTDLEGSIRFEL